jgi:hypothetical protein
VPIKTTSLLAVHAQTVDQNIGWPLQKLFSYSCSTTLVFKILKLCLKILRKRRSNRGKWNEKSRRRGASSGLRSRARPCALPPSRHPGPPRPRGPMQHGSDAPYAYPYRSPSPPSHSSRTTRAAQARSTPTVRPPLPPATPGHPASPLLASG